jgi:hypothetical protein
MKKRLWRVRDQSRGRELVLLDFYHDVQYEFDLFIWREVLPMSGFDDYVCVLLMLPPHTDFGVMLPWPTMAGRGFGG